MPLTPAPGSAPAPAPVETPEMRAVHNAAVGLKTALDTPGPGDVTVNLTQLQAAARNAKGKPDEATTLAMVIDIVRALGMNTMTVDNLLALAPANINFPLTDAQRTSALTAINTFLSRSPIAAIEAGRKHEEVRKKLQELQKAVKENAATKEATFKEFIDLVKAFETAHGGTAALQRFTAAVNRTFAATPAPGSKVSDTLEIAANRNALLTNPDAAQAILAAEVGPGLPAEVTASRISARIDGFVGRFLENQPGLVQKIQEWTGMAPEEIAQTMRSLIKGFIAGKFRTMVPDGGGLSGMAPKFNQIAMQLDWENAVDEFRRENGGAEPDPAARKPWMELYDGWARNLRAVTANATTLSGIDVGPMPTIKDAMDNAAAVRANNETVAKTIQETLKKTAAAAPGAPGAPVAPGVAPGGPEALSRTSVTDYFKDAANNVITEKSITEGEGTAKTLKMKNGTDVKIFRGPVLAGARVFIKIGARAPVEIYKNATDSVGLPVSLQNPAGNTDIDAVRIRTDNNANGQLLKDVIDRLNLPANAAHTKVTITPGSADRTTITSA